MIVVPEQEREAELPERWSAKAKVDVVLRLLRGESVEAVSREVQVPAHELEAWRRTFLESAIDGLKRRHGDAETRLLKQAQMLMHAAINDTKDIVPSATHGANAPMSLAASPVAWLTVVVLWIPAAYFLFRMRGSDIKPPLPAHAAQRPTGTLTSGPSDHSLRP